MSRPHMSEDERFSIETARGTRFWAQIDAWMKERNFPTYADLWDENVRLQAALEAHNRALTPGEAAKLLGVTRKTIGNMVADGRLVPLPQPRSLPRRFDPEANPLLKNALQGEHPMPNPPLHPPAGP